MKKNIQDGWARFKLAHFFMRDIQDVDVSTTVPADGDALVWVDADKKWEPGAIKVRGFHDEFTAPSTPATTYTLSFVPVDGTCQMSLNGHILIEGIDYTCDYPAGTVTVAATLASGDQITFRYLTTTPIPPVTFGFKSASGDFSTFAGSGTVTVVKPLGLSAGDTMFAFAVPWGSGNFSNVVAPSGWTLKDSDNGGAAPQIGIYTRVAGSGEPSDYTWTLTGGGFLMVGISAYTDVASVDEFHAHAAHAGLGASSYTTPAMTGSPDTDLLIFAGTAQPSYMLPAAVTQRLDIHNATDGVHLVLGDWQEDGSGATQTTIVQPASQYYATGAFAVH